jgi:hypothetical protein
MSQFDSSFIQPQTPKGALKQERVNVLSFKAPLGVWGKGTSTKHKSDILNLK